MTTGLDVFDTTIEKTNRILKEIEEEFGWQDRRNQSYHALRTVLHALRDRLTVKDSVNFASELPLLLKGVYFDGWDPDIVPIKMNKNEFVNYVACEFLLDYEGGTEELIRKVSNKIFMAIDPNESDKIISNLPDDVAELFY